MFVSPENHEQMPEARQPSPATFPEAVRASATQPAMSHPNTTPPKQIVVQVLSWTELIQASPLEQGNAP
jgi:hypothetical protein